MVPAPDSIFIDSNDGLKLHVRRYGERNGTALPVVCLPGLTRTIADFDELAAALAGGAGRVRQVFSLDYRGRGRSDHDKNPANYSLPVELADVITVLTSLKAAPAIFVGTSRGGILAMLLASVQPSAIAGVVLNDIGPVLEASGLRRIGGYVGKLPHPETFEEAAETFSRLFGPQFPNLTLKDWLVDARRTFRDENGRLVLNYDPAISKSFSEIDLDKPLPTLWNEFDALARVPIMVIRGANSDILSAATVETMRARHPTIETIEAAGQGHAPLLSEPSLIARITAFAARCDAQARR